MNFNRAVLVGRLTNDPEVRTLPSGQPVVSFGLATNRIWTDQNGNRQETTEFHNIVAFGKLADICSRYLTKGRLALVEGRIQTRSWQDREGNKRYRTEIVADNMQMGPRVDLTGTDQKPLAPSPPEPAPASPSQEEIPVIEAEEPVSQPAEPAEENKEEVDVKNIPF